MFNTRSLERYPAGIKRARQLTDDEILCLTESRISNDTHLTDILDQVSSFKIYLNLYGVKHQNLAFCLDEDIAFSKHDTFSSISDICY